MVFLGLEAEEVNALVEVNKKLNLQRGVQSYEEAFRRIHRAGIAVLGAFIFGMDGDTPEKLRRRTEYMIHSGVDVMQTTFLTPLPGTRLFRQFQKQDRLLYADFPQDWDRYDMTEVVYEPAQMGPAALAKTSGECNERMFAWPVLMCKAARTLWETRNLTATMFAWNSNINYRNVSLAP
jgi:radical SAM superfamily enzyme YgiQ (UPF0313 family)